MVDFAMLLVRMEELIGWMNGWTDSRMDDWIDRWMFGWMESQVDDWMDE